MKLYRCPGLCAWISVRQCRYNAALAARASQGFNARVAALHVRATCTGCPGVQALGEGVRDLPELRTAEGKAPKLPRKRTLVPLQKTWKAKAK